MSHYTRKYRVKPSNQDLEGLSRMEQEGRWVWNLAFDYLWYNRWQTVEDSKTGCIKYRKWSWQEMVKIVGKFCKEAEESGEISHIIPAQSRNRLIRDLVEAWNRWWWAYTTLGPQDKIEPHPMGKHQRSKYKIKGRWIGCPHRKRHTDSVSLYLQSANGKYGLHLMDDKHPKRKGLKSYYLNFINLGLIYVRTHRVVPTDIVDSIRLIRDTNEWYVVLIIKGSDSHIHRHNPTDQIIGVDRGIALSIATSKPIEIRDPAVIATIKGINPKELGPNFKGNPIETREIPNPKYLYQSAEKLAELNRSCSALREEMLQHDRDTPEWRGVLHLYLRAKQLLARLHRKVRRQREHFWHVLSSALASRFKWVVLELLNVAGMSRSRLAKGILDAGWGIGEQMCDYKSLEVLFVDPRYTSQTCRKCGHVARANRTTQSDFKCVVCGHTNNADVNAAEVIELRGQEALANRIVAA